MEKSTKEKLEEALSKYPPPGGVRWDVMAERTKELILIHVKYIEETLGKNP